MSREERRNYERMMRNMERGPQLPPAAKARAERNAQRRAARASAPTTVGFTRRFIVVSTLIALAAGFIAFSLQWPNIPFALYVGVAVAAVALGVQVAMRFLRRRMAAR
jgi:ABC-type multidrug transport system fused ATPase/permease subunit